jgi:large subunit ribosomal protein L3
MEGMIGRKLGMTQVFDPQGHRVAITAIELGPCQVVQRKTLAGDGYDAVQLGFGDIRESRTRKPALARFKKAGVPPKRTLREFSVDGSEAVKAGDTVTVAMFEGVTHVDVIGTTKGRGFQGVIKRHLMKGGPFGHGGHSKRRVGSVGQKTWPARIHPGQRMPGHMGHVRVTQQNLRVVQVRPAENLLLVEGAVPGPNGGVLAVRRALKKTGKA